MRGAHDGFSHPPPRAILLCRSSLRHVREARIAIAAASGSGFTGIAQSLTFGAANSGPAANLELDAVAVNAVPLPGSFWLMLSGALGLVGMGRRGRIGVV